jgi:hypothetical protein
MTPSIEILLKGEASEDLPSNRFALELEFGKQYKKYKFESIGLGGPTNCFLLGFK